MELLDEVDAVVLAVGMGADLDMTYPGDDLDGVWESLPFIERLKTGEPPAVGKRVAVIGGGNTAVDVAVEAKRLGAEVSLLLYRRTEQEMPAYDHEVELARDEGVEIRLLTSPIAFVGEDHVEGVRCAEMRLGARDESGRRRPEPVPGSEFVIPVDTVVKAIGQRPRDEFRRLLADVDEGGRTRHPRIFAAGDAVNGGASVVQAVAEAKRAVAAVGEVLA
jgi:glutamate synthase (NADPH/NADH) small chain